MTKYLELLLVLKSYGEKLPAALVVIEEWVQATLKAATALTDLFGGGLNAAAPYAATGDELVVEGELAALGGEGRSGFLQNILTLLKEHPEIWQLLLLFLKKS